MAESGSRSWLWSLRKEEVKEELAKYRVTFEPDAKLAELRFLLRTALNQTKTANGGRAGRYDKLLVDLERSEIELDGLEDPEGDTRDDGDEGEERHQPSDEEETEEAEDENRLQEEQIRAEIEAEERERDVRERIENDVRERIENEVRERIENEVRERIERELRERAKVENDEAERERNEREQEEQERERRENERAEKERAERQLRERFRREIRAQIAREREQPARRPVEARPRPDHVDPDQGATPTRNPASTPGPRLQQPTPPARRSVTDVTRKPTLTNYDAGIWSGSGESSLRGNATSKISWNDWKS
ncbi:trichohyalin-like [Cotesia glomerata]|uniref:trichohyalin-like n=1 Tax=Cotesia glomerata TaxID=32391 RepID=UPI001D024A04|nr:trichohyalin-like [Cotesia glomerata]